MVSMFFLRQKFCQHFTGCAPACVSFCGKDRKHSYITWKKKEWKRNSARMTSVCLWKTLLHNPIVECCCRNTHIHTHICTETRHSKLSWTASMSPLFFSQLLCLFQLVSLVLSHFCFAHYPPQPPPAPSPCPFPLIFGIVSGAFLLNWESRALLWLSVLLLGYKQ